MNDTQESERDANGFLPWQATIVSRLLDEAIAKQEQRLRDKDIPVPPDLSLPPVKEV